MNTKYYLAIPITLGLIVGMVLVFNGNYKDDILLTESKLINGGSPILGDPSAPITILEWGDYQCTFCYRFHETTLETIKEEFIETGKVKLVFKDFPLNGPDSVLAAEASFCAEDQGKYWDFHNIVYQNWAGERTGWITRVSLDDFARIIGLDVLEFNNCIDAHKYGDKINHLYDFGKEIGIDATPSFLVFNDEKIIKIRGNQPLEVFLKTIEEL